MEPRTRADVLSDLRSKLHALTLLTLGLEATTRLDSADAVTLTDLIDAAQRDVDQLEGNTP